MSPQAVAPSIHLPHRFGIFIHPNPLSVLLTAAIAALTALALLTIVVLSLLRRQHAARSRHLRHLTSAMRPGGEASLLLAYLLHWLPYATQSRQTFSFYYIPAYYFAILLTARAFDYGLTAAPRGGTAVVMLLTLLAALATGAVAWKVRLPVAAMPSALPAHAPHRPTFTSPTHQDSRSSLPLPRSSPRGRPCPSLPRWLAKG